MPPNSLSQVRHLVATHRPRISAEGYRPEVRAAVIAAARDRIAEGWTRTRLAGELGLAATTLTAWLREPTAPSFRAVTLTDERAPSWAAAPGVLTLVTPGGYRLEGLDLAGAVALLSRLS